MFDPVTREYEGVGFTETESGDRNVVVFPRKDQRHRDLERSTRVFYDGENARKLCLVNHHRRADETAARERYIDHRDDDEEGDLRESNTLVNEEAEQRCRREREEQRYDKR
jgi:hypothetical protein